MEIKSQKYTIIVGLQLLYLALYGTMQGLNTILIL